MKKVFSSPELSTAESVQAFLIENRIAASLSNQNEYNLTSQYGYADNMRDSHPTVWVINDNDLQRAHSLITGLEELPETMNTSTFTSEKQKTLANNALSIMLNQGLKILALVVFASGILFSIYWKKI